MDARCHAVVMTVENQKETKKKSVTAGLYLSLIHISEPTRPY